MKHISKLLAMLLAITLCLTTLLPELTVSVKATQSLSLKTSGYTLTGNMATDIVAVATAQLDRTGTQMGATEYWCADFVYNCARAAGIGSDIIKTTGGVELMRSHLLSNGGTVVTTPQAGDLVFYYVSSDYGHVAIMVDSKNCISGNLNGTGSGSSFYTTSKVCKHAYTSYSSYKSVQFIRPNYNNLPVPTLSNESTLNGYYYVSRADGTGVWSAPSSVPDEYYTTNIIDLNYGEVIYLSSKGTTSSSGLTWARIADKYGIWDNAGVNGVSFIGDYIYYGHLTAVTTGKYHVSDRFGGSPTMYKTASKSGTSVGTVPKNVTLNVTKIEYDSSGIGYAYCTYNGVSGYIPIGFLNYGEASGSSSSTTTVTAKWSTYSAKHSVGETNATLAGTLTLTGTTASSVTRVGIDLYDSTGNTKLASKEEDNKTTSGSTVNMWYNVNSELGYTLKAGTTYKYKFHAIINGKTYYSDWLTVKTTGTSTQTYTITYNANGGSNPPSAQTKTHGTTLTLSSTKPTRTGYTFLGWSTSSTATSATYSAGGSFTTNANTTLYAVWKANTYTISYNANGGSTPPSAQTKTHGTTLTLSSTKPTRTGYTFLGWSTSSTATSATYSAGGSFTTNANTTLYAVWKANTYTISYNANGGSGAPSAQTKTHGTTLTLSSTKPTRDGYTFLGWSINANATSATYSAGSYFTTNANTTLYAVWTKDPIAEIALSETTVSKGDTITVTVKFTGEAMALYSSIECGNNLELVSGKWITSKERYMDDVDGNSAFAVFQEALSFNDESIFVYTLKAVNNGTADVDVALKYTSDAAADPREIDIPSQQIQIANTYTISYNANGGSVAPASQTKTHDVTLTLSSTKPTRTGYTFLGWSTDSSATSATYSAGGSFTTNANTTLYAVWKANTYTISYNANGGSVAPASQTKTHDVTLTLSSTKPTRTGYTFLGWSTSSTATSATYSAGASFTTNANTALYAVWKADTYTISYNANGGSNAPASQTKTHDVALTLSSAVPTRDGYTFLGWSTSSSATSATYSAGSSFTTDANTTLYAVWSQNEILPTPTDMSAYVTVSKTKVSVDGTVEVDVYYTGKMQSLYTTPILGDNFELVSCRWLINEDDIFPASIVMKNVSMQTCEAAIGLDEPAEFDNYKVCRYVYKAVSEGTSQIGAVVKASAIGNKVSVIIPTSPVTVTVSKYLPGDFNDDGVVTLDDAIYLLYYTFNPDGYPLNQPGDFNHDGIITLDDAIYLLYYTFNPMGYPLS